MNNFISNIISRHVASNQNVLPRLRSRFEPMENAGSTTPTDFLAVKENFAEPIQGTAQMPSKPGANISLKPGNGGTDKIVNSLFSFPATSLQNEHAEHSEISETHPQKANPVITPLNQFEYGYLQNSAQQNDDIAPVIDNKIENHNVDHFETNHFQNRAVGGEFIKNKKEKEKDIFSNAIDDKSNHVKPFLEKMAVKEISGKYQGLLGEPPSAKAFQNLKATETSLSNIHNGANKPVIKVSIGQIHVRAVNPPQVITKKPRVISQPGLSLETYLKQRNKGE